MISADFRVLGCRCIAGAGTQLPLESTRFSLLECIQHVRDPLKKVPNEGVWLVISGDFRVLGCRCTAGAGTQLPSESTCFSLLECIQHV